MKGTRPLTTKEIKQALSEFNCPNPNGSVTFKVFCQYNYPNLENQAHEIWGNRHKINQGRKNDKAKRTHKR